MGADITAVTPLYINHSKISPEHLNNILVPAHQNRSAKPLMAGYMADLLGAVPLFSYLTE